jgi:hypothetical protein
MRTMNFRVTYMTDMNIHVAVMSPYDFSYVVHAWFFVTCMKINEVFIAAKNFHNTFMHSQEI